MFNYWRIVEKKSGVVCIQLNRPEKKNAFNMDVFLELEDIIDKINETESYKILIIASTSEKYYTAGADIDWFLNTTGQEGEEISVALHRILKKVEKLRIPVIAAVKGLCLTAGVELALCCDFIFAAENAKFGQIETKWGLTPGAGGTQRLVRLVGPLKARELIYTAKIINAQEAYKIGLLNEVVPLDEFDNYIEKFCKLLLNNSQNAIRESKILIQRAIYENEIGFAEEKTVFGDRFASGEPKALFQSFFKSKAV
jgi:enoyl-CoA hydratase